MKAWLTSLKERSVQAAPIGLDFAAQRLNLLQAIPSPDGPAVRAAVSLPYPV